MSRKHVFKPSDIDSTSIVVPAHRLKMGKPKGKIECKQLADMLLKKFDAETLKNKYLGWFLAVGQVYPRAYIRWADVTDANNKKQKVLQPVQVKLAAHFFKSLSGEDLDACKSRFGRLEDIIWHRDAAKNPGFMTTSVVRKKKPYQTPLFTLANLTRAVRRKSGAAAPRKRKKPSVVKPETNKDAWIKTKRSKKNKPLVKVDAMRELRQEQLTLDDTSIFQNAAGKSKKKKRSRPKKTHQKKASNHKKQKKNPVVHDQDRWGYLNKQILLHWNKSSFAIHETLSWAAGVFTRTKKKELVMKTPVAGKPYAANFNNFPDPADMIHRAKIVHATENPLYFTIDHEWIAEPEDIQWTKYTKKKLDDVVVVKPPPPSVVAILESPLIRKKPLALDVTLPAPADWNPSQEMNNLGFAYQTATARGGGRQTYAPHMLFYAKIGELPTDVVSKYRIKNLANPGMFRVLSQLREWLIQHQYWNKVLQYDPWNGIENELKNLHFKKNEEVVEKLFVCISNHLQTSDPVDLYYEFHDTILKKLQNAVADKGDSVKATVDRARKIFNLLCKIKSPTRDLAASARGFQGERQNVLWGLVHIMIVLKNETSSRKNWRATVLNAVIKEDNEKDTYDEDSMHASGDSFLSGKKSPDDDDDRNRTEWQRNRFTSSVVQIWDVMRKYEGFFPRIQNLMEKRGFKKIKTISDFMAPSRTGPKGQQMPPGLGRTRFRFYILNTFNHLFPYGSPESNLHHYPVSDSTRQAEDKQFQALAAELTKAFGLSSKEYFKGI